MLSPTSSKTSNSTTNNSEKASSSRQIAYGSFNDATSSSAICDMDNNDDGDGSKAAKQIGISSSRSDSSNRMEHLGQHRQYARDMILGVNDGIISTFLLVAGVSGSGLTTEDIFFTAVAGALAGAVSMSAGGE